MRGLPDRLDTVVGDRGYRLSGGEKQRMAIARLLLKAPGVVVLDEATAHLDSESEAAVQRALKTALAGRTSVVIAHRLSTVREADQILVLEDGRIAERGRHDELLAAGGLYAELYRTQFERQASEDDVLAVDEAGRPSGGGAPSGGPLRAAGRVWWSWRGRERARSPRSGAAALLRGPRRVRGDLVGGRSVRDRHARGPRGFPGAAPGAW